MRPYRHLFKLAGLFLFVCTPDAYAIDPSRTLAQYSRTVWTEAQGLHQDTIRDIAQTRDGYLWLATDEGLVRFDGYDFVTYSESNSELPDNLVTTLTASSDGSLWLGTPFGLVHYRDGQFRTYTVKDGLPENYIFRLTEDREGTLWIVAGTFLGRFQAGKFTNFMAGADIPNVHQDHRQDLWVSGFGGVAKWTGARFELVVDSAALNGDPVGAILVDRHDDLWIGTTNGLVKRSPSGKIRRYTGKVLVRALREDGDGNIWVVSDAGLGRIEEDRFVTSKAAGAKQEALNPLCIFEDREGNLWVGSTRGLNRFRDNSFITYGTDEGLPSDEVNTVFQDHAGRIWVGFRDKGLMLFSPEGHRSFTENEGLPENYVVSIREGRTGELLVATRRGLARLRDMKLYTYPRLPGKSVYDALEDSAGRLWVAIDGGLIRLQGNEVREVIAGGVSQNYVRILSRGPDGALWVGSSTRGLWRIQGEDQQLFTVADGLPSDKIRSLSHDADGTLWIGTFGGGLGAFRDGRFLRFTAKDGLLSDNIAKITDDGESLWLSTTLGICRIKKQQLHEFAENKRKVLEPVNYDGNDGLRSANIAPSYRAGGGGTGGTRTSDGRLWFTTSRGLAVFSPTVHNQNMQPPAVHIEDVAADGQPVDFRRSEGLSLKTGRIEIGYTGIHLTAPERVRYSYKLDGLDHEWVDAGTRRTSSYSNLGYGAYRFRVKAELPNGLAAEQLYAFELLPKIYETAWFQILALALLIAGVWAGYQFHLRQIRYRFQLVVEERARLAREIHDTLAQDVFGISTQLEALALQMPKEEGAPERNCLDVARRMARHCLTEARWAVMDLRSASLEGRDLPTALESDVRLWTAGSGMDVDMEVDRPLRALSREMEQHLLRIAQEAVNNALKHAGTSKIWVKLHVEARKLYLRIADNGRGFQPQNELSGFDGHFGLVGMRERAKRLGGEFHLMSQPGAGTCIEVVVPLP